MDIEKNKGKRKSNPKVTETSSMMNMMVWVRAATKIEEEGVEGTARDSLKSMVTILSSPIILKKGKLNHGEQHDYRY